MWYVYIIRCGDGTLYTGSTTNIDRRLEEHNTKKGGHYTRVRMPVRLMHREAHQDRVNAQKREAQIKRWSRSKKVALIEHNKTKLRTLSISHD